jgi:sarcosine oxidase
VKTHYEYIVLGCGGLGSAALYWLARAAGNEVLGLEQFAHGHHNGGSQDHSRIIRRSYHAPEYMQLAPHAYSAWAEVEAESGVQLVYKTGGLDIGAPADGGLDWLERYAAELTNADVPYERLSAPEVMRCWPQWHLPPGAEALYQAEGGLVDARKANAVHALLARDYGATLLERTPVRQITPIADGVELETAAGRLSCRRLVVTTGAWTARVLSQVGLHLPITVTQEQVTYFQPPHLRQFAPERFPIWMWLGPGGYYGFPVYGEVAVKVAEEACSTVVTPETRTFEPSPGGESNLRRFLARYLPGAIGPVLYSKTCLYDMPPDRNFVLDRLPDHPQIVVANGAAHSFKFASLIGRIMSELATAGRSQYPIAPFRLGRRALTDPDYPREFVI